MSPTLKAKVASAIDGAAAVAAAVAAFLAAANPEWAAVAAPYVAGTFAALAALRSALGVRKAKQAKLPTGDPTDKPAMVYGPSARKERRG